MQVNDASLDAQDVRRRVVACFETTAAEHERELAPLTDDLLLEDSGMDSLCFAIVVAVLEDELGADPFAELEEAQFPVTFGAFVKLYETAVLERAAA